MMAAIVLLAGIEAWARHAPEQRIGRDAPAQIQGAADERAIRAAESDFDPFQDSVAQWIMAIFAIAATGASVWAVVLLRDTLRETRLATKTAANGVAEAAETNRITRAAYVNDHRPWLSIGEPRIELIEARGGRFRVSMRLDVKNVGKSPAIAVRLHGAFYRIGMSARHARSLEDFCKECVAEDPGGRNRLLFPDQSEDLRISTDRDLIGEATVPKIAGIGFLLCVTYRSIVAETPFHIGVAGTAITKPMRVVGINETLTTEDIEVVTRNEYTSMN